MLQYLFEGIAPYFRIRQYNKKPKPYFPNLINTIMFIEMQSNTKTHASQNEKYITQ